MTTRPPMPWPSSTILFLFNRLAAAWSISRRRSRGGRIGTGFIGTPALLPALIKIGEPELAAAVFLQEEVPGWLYQVKTGPRRSGSGGTRSRPTERCSIRR